MNIGNIVPIEVFFDGRRVPFHPKLRLKVHRLHPDIRQNMVLVFAHAGMPHTAVVHEIVLPDSTRSWWCEGRCYANNIGMARARGLAETEEPHFVYDHEERKYKLSAPLE